MVEPRILRENLEGKDNLGWFDTMCDILKRSKHPTTNQLIELIGIDKPNPNNEIRGSRFLIPHDVRFKFACISPDVSKNDSDTPLEYLAFGGEKFNLKMHDLIERFSAYRTHRNIYDGGTQIFFYPVSYDYEFSAIEFWIKKEPEEIENITELEFHTVTFMFGDHIYLGRDGYHMRR